MNVVFEKQVIKWIMEYIQCKPDPDHLGGMKGSSISHYLIEFKTDNRIIANDRTNIHKAQAYLKEHLQNQKLSLKSIITEKEENKFAYTDEEKFDEMKKSNPALQDLKDQLDLEIEF